MAPDFKIRKITAKDNKAIANLIRTVMPEFNCDGPGFAIHDSEVDKMFEAYNQPRSAYFVLELGGVVVGGGGIAPLQGGAEDTCELKKMYFMTAARGSGKGHEILMLCLAEAKKFGYKKCYLETTTGMLAAQKLYRKVGFELLDAPMGVTGHHGCDKWYLKVLG